MNNIIITSYHNHTIWSDGSASAAEMVAAAAHFGISEIGISDHYTLAPDEQIIDWSMPLNALDDYAVDITCVKNGAQNISVLLGIEADFFPSTIAKLAPLLDCYPFDYRIGSLHFIDGFAIDENAESWEKLSEEERDEVCRRYWQTIPALASSRAFDIVGHLDLYKKFGFRPSIDLSQEITAALDAIADNNLAIELNTAGWAKPIGEAYPSETLLIQAHQRNIPLCINSDAHQPAQLGGFLQKGRELAYHCGYRELCRFQQRERSMLPLNQ